MTYLRKQKNSDVFIEGSSSVGYSVSWKPFKYKNAFFNSAGIPKDQLCMVPAGRVNSYRQSAKVANFSLIYKNIDK